MLTDADLYKIGQVMDQKLYPIKQDLKELRIKVDRMYDAMEQRGILLEPA